MASSQPVFEVARSTTSSVRASASRSGRRAVGLLGGPCPGLAAARRWRAKSGSNYHPVTTGGRKGPRTPDRACSRWKGSARS